MLPRPYALSDYGAMITDRVRMAAHAEALWRVVRPGCVVLDIGTGPGLFALMACRLGARRVYAVEPHDIIQVGSDLAAANGCVGRIEFIQNLSTRVTLPELADVIIADVRGPLPGPQVPTLIDARRRLLAPGGALIPRRDTLWAAVVQAPEAYRRQVAVWDEAGDDFNFAPARRLATNQIHTGRKGQMTPEQFLTEPRKWGEIDYLRVEKPGLAADLNWTVTRPGTGHGVIAWFDTTLVEGVGFSNTPLEPERVYGSAFFPWPDPVSLAAGDTVAVALRLPGGGEDDVWCWDSCVTAAHGSAGRVKASFRQSEFFGTPLAVERLRELGADHVARLNKDGEIDRFVLALIDGKKTLGDIARLVSGQFPERFPTWEAALTRVGEVSQAYSR
jgi:protein arginine N-methyltransferase 1